ncbi:MAG: PH domain-containing protein [bacterium]|nr:PH domain-containing protein [bacterium]
MTADSEISEQPIEPATDVRPVDSEVVLARGHLHPAILLLRLLDAMRQSVVTVVAGLALGLPWLLAIAAGMFLLQLGYALARYLTLEYRLTATELRVREGLLHRQERRIPLDRIQDLGFESTILRRALGLTVVLVETASGSGVEARLDALSRSHADHLREVLLEARREIVAAQQAEDDAITGPGTADASAADNSTATASTAADEPEWLVHRSTSKELFLRGLTDLRLSAFVVTGFALFEMADYLGFLTQMSGVARGVRDWFAQFDPVVLGLLLLVLLLVVISFGVITGTVGNLVQFHGFQLTLRGSVLHRRFGLLTTRQKTLPRDRIQRVTIEQPWLRRATGYGVVKADSAGGSRAQGEDTAGGWDVVVPLTRLENAFALLPALLPGLEREHLPWQRGSRRLVMRTTIVGVLIGLAGAAALWSTAGSLALLALLTIPIWALLGILAFRNLAYALGDRFLALQHGIVGRYIAYLPTAKIQSVVVRQSPVEQLLGLAELTVHVAGGSPTRLPDLTIENALELRGELARIAAIAAARDWQTRANATATRPPADRVGESQLDPAAPPAGDRRPWTEPRGDGPAADEDHDRPGGAPPDSSRPL